MREIRGDLLKGSAIAALLALLLVFVATQSIGRRLLRITDFAERVAAGDLSARIQEGAGDEIAHVASALDKTARKLEEGFADLEASRQTLETLLNSMQEAVIASRQDERVLWANQRMERLLPSGVRLGAPLVQSVRDPEILASVQSALNTRDVTMARAAKIFSGRIFDVTAAPMPGGGAVAVLHDQTEIERVEKTRRDFIANVSHELRTPLTSIQGYAETLLESRNMPSNLREFVEIIRKNAMRMARLTEDLLVLARVESGEQKLNLQLVMPHELLDDAAQTFQEVAQRPRHRTVGDEHGILGGDGRSRCDSPGICQPDRQCAEVWRPGRARSWWEPANRKTACNSMFATSDRGSPANICPACSNASTAWTRRARGSRAGRAWVWRSPSTWCAPTPAPSGPRAN